METVKSITLISSLPFTLIFVILLCTASFAIARPFLALRWGDQLRTAIQGARATWVFP
jgi:hypothetical protein